MKNQTKKSKQELDDMAAQMNKLSVRLNYLKSRKTELFKGYADKKLSKESYIELKGDCLNEIERITQQISEFESKSLDLSYSTDTNDLFGTLERFGHVKEVNSEILSFIECINIFDCSNIEIQFNFGDMLEQINSLIKN